MNETSNKGKPNIAKRILSNPISGPYIALVILFIISTIASPDIFPTYTNIANFLRTASITGMVSIGMTIVLLVAGIDLSVTYVMAISACVLANMMEKQGEGGGISIGAVLLVLLIGCLVGLINGMIIVLRNVEPFIITLGTGQVLKGIIYIYTKGAPGGAVTEFWKNFGSESLFGVIPYAVILWVVMILIFGVILHKTVFGRHIYAIGSNEEAARLTGIKVKIHKIMAYVICGFTASLAGIMLLARVRVGEPNGANGYDMDAIAAVVIGGTAMSGGRGTLAGSIAGVLIMAIMNNILNLVGADPNLQIVIKGCIILLAVLVQRKND